MPTYSVRAFTADGAVAFGATIRCNDVDAAIERFHSLPLGGRSAQLFRGKRLIAFCEAEVERRRDAR